MNKIISFYGSRILAGCSISLGSYIYLRVGGPLGAFMFSVGLMSVVTFGFTLFTGKVRFFTRETWSQDILWLLGILLFNAVGCALCALMAMGDEKVMEACQAIVHKRAALGFLPSIATGMGCGFIMTLAVSHWKDTPWPLIIGVPAFILAGLTHSVADAFYYSVGWQVVNGAAMASYAGTVIGNFLGGLAYKAGSLMRFER